MNDENELAHQARLAGIEATAKARDLAAAHGMKYVKRIPSEIPKGQVLVHNVIGPSSR